MITRPCTEDLRPGEAGHREWGRGLETQRWDENRVKMDKKQPIDYGQEIGISISIATPLKCKVVWSVLSLMLYFYFIKYFSPI